MDSQHPEPIGLTKEAQPRNDKKIRRAVAVVIFGTAAAVGIIGVENNDDKPEAADIVVDAPQPQEEKMKAADKAEITRAQTAALIERAKREENERRFYDLVLWNNTVWFNELNKPKINYDSALWDRLHQCEQPGNWYANGHNPADPYHQLFQGGLGMSTEAWDMAIDAAAERGVTLPSSALDASVDQQMQGAQVFYEDHGWGWACDVR